VTNSARSSLSFGVALDGVVGVKGLGECFV
jgi:hypothetical protein